MKQRRKLNLEDMNPSEPRSALSHSGATYLACHEPAKGPVPTEELVAMRKS